MTPRRAYSTDLSDERWALIEPILAGWRAARRGIGIKEPGHDLREIVNAISWINRAACAWNLLPLGFPPYKTVHTYFSMWAKDGTTEQIHDLLRRKVREQAQRAPEPTAALTGAQSVETSSNVPETRQGSMRARRSTGHDQSLQGLGTIRRRRCARAKDRSSPARRH
ncbi:MAG TPA: transposase [Streptosporangiaceae bacterium]|nr:transposase [Streptosporangiaceae bacterium]